MADKFLGNTQEQISAYAEIYGYRVGDDFMEEAQRWFGCLLKPRSGVSEYYYWRKWNDPNHGQYCVKRGKKIIVDKRTGELAISPSFKDNVTDRQYKKGMEIWEKLKILYAEDVEEVVGMGALALEDIDDEEDEDEEDEDEEGDEEDEDEEVTVAMAAVRVE
jgi:hypothetical protein